MIVASCTCTNTIILKIFVSESNTDRENHLCYIFIFQGVQLHIEITDCDLGITDDLIDVLLIDYNQPIGQISPRTTYNGNFSFVTMDLSITARCVGNFQGSDCSRCLSGFAGTMCNVRITECSCSGHGQCLDGVPSLICDCNPGFRGMECETNIDDCIEVTCSGNGQCVDGVLSYTCNCDPGFTGVDCEVNIDDCAGVDCGENGVCLDGVNFFICQCNPGFMGELCQINIDDCAGVNCSGNGQCMDGILSYTCNCDPGFTGVDCDVNINDCVGINCSDNGNYNIKLGWFEYLYLSM